MFGRNRATRIASRARARGASRGCRSSRYAARRSRRMCPRGHRRRAARPSRPRRTIELVVRHLLRRRRDRASPRDRVPPTTPDRYRRRLGARACHRQLDLDARMSLAIALDDARLEPEERCPQSRMFRARDAARCDVDECVAAIAEDTGRFGDPCGIESLTGHRLDRKAPEL